MLCHGLIAAAGQDIAECEGRPLTWQMVHLMRECVRRFEKEHGSIHIREGQKDE